MKEFQVETIVDTLCCNMVSDKEQLRDISSIGKCLLLGSSVQVAMNAWVCGCACGCSCMGMCVCVYVDVWVCVWLGEVFYTVCFSYYLTVDSVFVS